MAHSERAGHFFFRHQNQYSDCDRCNQTTDIRSEFSADRNDGPRLTEDSQELSREEMMSIASGSARKADQRG
jgi:hypothetical protein